MFSRSATLLKLLFISGPCMSFMLITGCGDGVGTRYPVEGQVLVDGAPLAGMSGQVTFEPDQTKGNKTPVSPSGEIDKDGRYKLSSKGKPGAPAGWYKVAVSPVPPGTGDREVIVQ